MSGISTTLWERLASSRQSNFSGMTLEEEVRSLHALLPESMAQLPVLFAESVVKSCSSVLGEGPGEALVRGIGDDNLHDPAESYAGIDSVLSSGSDMLKEAIRQNFRERVHEMYRMAMNIEARGFAAELKGDTPRGPPTKLRVSSAVKVNQPDRKA